MAYELRQTHTRTRGRSGREVSGQYRVTVPDPDALDRLRTQNRVYDRTLMPRDRFAGSVPHWGTFITRFVEGIFDRTYGYGRGGENYAQDCGKRTRRKGSGTLRL